jgi:PIN domain-containing protein
MKRILIDTNILLNFYRFHKEGQSFDMIDNLMDLIEKNKIDLLLPRQIKNEFYRDKYIVANIYKKDLEILNKKKIATPAFIKKSKDVIELNKTQNKLKSLSKKIIKEYEKRILNSRSKINSKINKLFNVAINIDDSPEILQRAYFRTLRRDPPRKDNNSFGDAIIWESVLDNYIDEDLTIISNDGDFASEINNREISEFLLDEWRGKTKNKLSLCRSLGEYINKQTKKITIKPVVIEEEKMLNFVETGTPLGYLSTSSIGSLGSDEKFLNIRGDVEGTNIFGNDDRFSINNDIVFPENRIVICNLCRHTYVDNIPTNLSSVCPRCGNINA